MDALLTAKEVAAILRVHPNTVYEKAKNGEIPSVRTVNSRVRFIESDIRTWLERHARSSGSKPLLEEALQTDLCLANYDKLFLKGGVKVSPEGKTWNYPFGSVFLRLKKSQQDKLKANIKRLRKVLRLVFAKIEGDPIPCKESVYESRIRILFRDRPGASSSQGGHLLSGDGIEDPEIKQVYESDIKSKAAAHKKGVEKMPSRPLNVLVLLTSSGAEGFIRINRLSRIVVLYALFLPIIRVKLPKVVDP